MQTTPRQLEATGHGQAERNRQRGLDAEAGAAAVVAGAALAGADPAGTAPCPSMSGALAVRAWNSAALIRGCF